MHVFGHLKFGCDLLKLNAVQLCEHARDVDAAR